VQIRERKRKRDGHTAIAITSEDVAASDSAPIIIWLKKVAIMAEAVGPGLTTDCKGASDVDGEGEE